MKKKYISPVVRIKAIEIEPSVMAASTDSKQGFFEKSDKGFIQNDATDGSSVKGSEVLAKPMFWDDSENQ